MSERCVSFIMWLHLHYNPTAIYLCMNKTQEILYFSQFNFTQRWHFVKENQNFIYNKSLLWTTVTLKIFKDKYEWLMPSRFSFIMSAYLEDPTVATVLEKVNPHPNSQEKKWKNEVAQLCLTLCDPLDYRLPESSVHGIFQARILEWVAIFPSNSQEG